MNRLSPLFGIKFLLALALVAPLVASADDEEKSKDGSSTKQVHYPVSAIDLIAQLKKDEEALFKIKSLYVRAKGTIQQTQASSKEFERNGQNAQLNI